MRISKIREEIKQDLQVGKQYEISCITKCDLLSPTSGGHCRVSFNLMANEKG